MSPDHIHDPMRFGIGLRITLDKSNSNSYEHGLYIEIRMEETLHCSVAREKQTKKWTQIIASLLLGIDIDFPSLTQIPRHRLQNPSGEVTK